MARILLNLSGGIDSAYCMYDALRRGERLLVHHIRLTNHEGRQQLEHRAVKKIRAYIDAQKLPGSYTYLESGYDHGSLGWIPKDAAIWSFMTGVVLANPKHHDITEVIVPRHVDAFGHESDPAAGARRSDAYIRAFVKAVARRDVTILTPIGHLRKAAVMRACPPELLRLCWWCRTPRAGGRACHRCITCKVVDPVLAELRRNPA